MRFGVMSIPTMMIFQDGEPAAIAVGAQPKGALEQARPRRSRLRTSAGGARRPRPLASPGCVTGAPRGGRLVDEVEDAHAVHEDERCRRASRQRSGGEAAIVSTYGPVSTFPASNDRWPATAAMSEEAAREQHRDHVRRRRPPGGSARRSRASRRSPWLPSGRVESSPRDEREPPPVGGGVRADPEHVGEVAATSANV